MKFGLTLSPPLKTRFCLQNQLPRTIRCTPITNSSTCFSLYTSTNSTRVLGLCLSFSIIGVPQHYLWSPKNFRCTQGSINHNYLYTYSNMTYA